jgi:flagellin-like hook-associated protein FlgL
VIIAYSNGVNPPTEYIFKTTVPAGALPTNSGDAATFTLAGIHLTASAGADSGGFFTGLTATTSDARTYTVSFTDGNGSSVSVAVQNNAYDNARLGSFTIRVRGAYQSQETRMREVPDSDGQFPTPDGGVGVKIHFGPGNDAAEDYYYIKLADCTASALGLAAIEIKTQDGAQRALKAIDAAIVKKDQARAYLGAMQNRLENTVSNLTVQSENLSASESRISDADIAVEMTRFVKNQILTQAAVAMLAQANSLPRIVLQLLSG